MKSRVNLPSEPYQNDQVNDTQDEEPAISRFSNKVLSKDDIKTITFILNRHSPPDKTDIFGRINFMDFYQSKVTHKQWPSVNVSVATSQLGTYSYYRSLSENMLCSYIKKLIDKKDMLPPEALLEIPVIEMHRMFPMEHTCAADLTDVPHLEFELENVLSLYRRGHLLFNSRFKEFFIRFNQKRYFYINVCESDIENKRFRVVFDKYSGDSQQWLMQGHGVFDLQFHDSDSIALPCDINTIESWTYEEILSKYIDSMNWDAKAKRFWADIFDIPQKWNDISVATMLNEDDMTELHQLIYNAQEQRVMRKAYGKTIDIISEKNAVRDKLYQVNRVHDIPVLLRTLAVVYLLLDEEHVKPDSVETDSYGRLRQRFGKVVVFSKEPYNQKE